MTEPFAGARGPRRPLDLSGLDAAVADGRQRVRRRRAAAGAGVLSVSVLATLAVGSAVRDPAPTPVDPARDARAFVSVEERHGDPACVPAPPAGPHESRQTLCAVIDGPATMVAGEPVRFTYARCLDPAAAGTTTIEYYTRDYVSLFVHEAGEGAAIAAWGDASPRPHFGRSEVVLSPGECWVWTVEWDGRDGAGRKVPPGRYVVHPIGYRNPSSADARWPSHAVEVTR